MCNTNCKNFKCKNNILLQQKYSLQKMNLISTNHYITIPYHLLEDKTIIITTTRTNNFENKLLQSKDWTRDLQHLSIKIVKNQFGSFNTPRAVMKWNKQTIS